MNLYQFMSDSPWLTFFLAALITELIFRSWNRTMRAFNIRKHGYPPPHCDADGDLKDNDSSEE